MLTVDPRFATYPATDNTLEAEVAGKIKVYKTPAVNYFSLSGARSLSGTKISAGFAAGEAKSFGSKVKKFVRGNFFIPDPRRGWNRYAYRKALEIIKNEGIEYVITTSPPHSTQLIGLRLKKKLQNLKWIVDFRDPWTDIYYYNMFHHTLPALIIDRLYEKTVLKTADLVLTVGDSMAKLLRDKAEIPTDRVRVLTNGYDEADFAGLKPSREEEDFIITYVGTISGHYPLEGFLLSVRSLVDNFNKRIILKFVGHISEQQRSRALAMMGKTNVQFIPYADHRESIQHMLDSDILLMVIPDHTRNRLIITGKLFEYLRTGNQILCLGPPDGDAVGIIIEAGAGATIQYNDIEEITSFIKCVTKDRPSYSPPKLYNRMDITETLINLLIEI